MILCKFDCRVSPKCLEWLEFLSDVYATSMSGEVEIMKTPFGLIRSDEGLVQLESLLHAKVEVSDCASSIRFTFYPPRQVEFGGEFAQKLFSMIAPCTIHLQSHIPPEFLKRHGAGRVFIKDFIEYPIKEFASRNEYKGARGGKEVESN